MAEAEHTALLLKCYTKLKDFSTLEEFLETTPPSQYDHATAIEVLESASYYGLASEVARKVGRFDDFVRISLEQFKNCSATVEFLHSLPKAEAGRILLQRGRALMRHAPKETIALVRQVFLRSVLLDEGCQLPPAKDAKRLLDVCKRCGPADQSLWVQALSFLSSPESGGRHLEEIQEVLRHIEDSDLMPLLLVIETLRHSEEVTIGDVRPYLQAQYKRLVDSLETSRGKSAQDRHEIARMQQEIIKLRTEAKEFQNTRCFQCGLTLDVPAVHFFCGHSYHSYCTPSDGTCPKCSSGALPKLSLKEQREAQARNVEDFFKYLQGGAGDRGVQAMGEWCKFGAFDAAQIDPED
ncbi:unnamed protein product, partial [Durusdinium trenchii]